MTFLIYDHIELQERESKHLKAWKGCHLVLYLAAAVFGVMNFVFIQNTMHLVDENCVLFPRILEFKWVELPIPEETDQSDELNTAQKFNNMTDRAQDPANDDGSEDNPKIKRDTTVTEGSVTADAGVTTERNENGTEDANETVVTRNTTHRLFLDTSRTLFENDDRCQFAEFMPIMSSIVAAVWLTLFTMCPGGGHARAGLQQPWRILTPALLFAIVLVGLTGRSFTITNQGLHDFCGAFSNVTNSTTCSAVDAFLEHGYSAAWGFGARAAAARAAAAAALAAWACAAALLLARCLAAPDFQLQRTGVYLTEDPQQKIMPHLRVKSPRSRSQRSRSSSGSPTKRDTASVRSEPTAVTELVSASVEPDHDSAPSSLMSTPMRLPRNTDAIEMQERFHHHP